MARGGNLVDRLTPRERQVFHLLMADKQNKEIACELGITPRTATFHVMALLRKLKCSTRYEIQKRFRGPRFEEVLVLADLVGRVTALENKVKEMEANA
jgi:DNA-binding CsgD family transcriptional regulator